LQAIQVDGSHDPRARDHGHQLNKTNQVIDDLGAATNSGMTPLGEQKAMTKAITETMSHRTVGEPPPCLKCRHSRHSNTMPHLTTMWAQDHDDNYAQMYSTRLHSLQVKLARLLPQAHNPSVGRTFFFIHALVPDSI
jgi:hypothetical protein